MGVTNKILVVGGGGREHRGGTRTGLCGKRSFSERRQGGARARFRGCTDDHGGFWLAYVCYRFHGADDEGCRHRCNVGVDDVAG